MQRPHEILENIEARNRLRAEAGLPLLSVDDELKRLKIAAIAESDE